MSNGKLDPFRGYLTDDEWSEMVALEYVITWGYSKEGESEKDYERYNELRNGVSNPNNIAEL